MLKIEMIKLFEDNAIRNKGARIQKKKKKQYRGALVQGSSACSHHPSSGPFPARKNCFHDTFPSPSHQRLHMQDRSLLTAAN